MFLGEEKNHFSIILPEKASTDLIMRTFRIWWFSTVLYYVCFIILQLVKLVQICDFFL